MSDTTTTKMRIDPELRTKWLEALRSEEYAGREHYVELVNSYHYATQNFCALGLAAHVTGIQVTNPDEESEAYETLKAQGVSLGDVWSVFDIGQNMTFKQFADWLEANSEAADA